MENLSDVSQEQQVSILGPSLRFRGEFHAEEDVLIKGRLEGSITHSQRLTVCREGQVKGDILGHIISVSGTVEGDLQASTSVSVSQNASVTGDISAPSISIVEGARFNGSVIMDGSKKSRAAGVHARASGTRDV